MYGNIAYAFLHYVLGFTYVDPKPILPAEEIHRAKDTLKSGDIWCKKRQGHQCIAQATQ